MGGSNGRCERAPCRISSSRAESMTDNNKTWREGVNDSEDGRGALDV